MHGQRCGLVQHDQRLIFMQHRDRCIHRRLGGVRHPVQQALAGAYRLRRSEHPMP
jgi:hypothetical protein